MGSMENVSKPREEDQKFEFPVGFRFYPTDEELINQYLAKKVSDNSFSAIAIAEVDMNRCEPWDLPGLAKMGEAEWYYFCVKDRKYPTGLRANRATDTGYWKATGKDKEIINENTLIGMKKTLVFYKGRAPKGQKTNWVMHEYRLEDNKYSEYNLYRQGMSEWVICRVYEKSPYGKKLHIPKFGRVKSNSAVGGPSLAAPLFPPLINSSPYNSDTKTTACDLSQVTCFSDPNQTGNLKTREDDHIVESKETPILNISSSSTPFEVSYFANATPLMSNQTPQVANQVRNSQILDCFQPQEHSMMRMLMEDNGSSAKQNQKAEFFLGRDFDDGDISSLVYNNDMFQRWLGNQEYSTAASVGHVDVDFLWNY